MDRPLCAFTRRNLSTNAQTSRTDGAEERLDWQAEKRVRKSSVRKHLMALSCTAGGDRQCVCELVWRWHGLHEHVVDRLQGQDEQANDRHQGQDEHAVVRLQGQGACR